MKDIKPSIYKLATKAFHGLGDISNDTPDICSVCKEDEENFYGAWVYGIGFIDVRFPKATTRDLNPEEVEYYHGKNISMGGMVTTLNLKGEVWDKQARVTNARTGKVREGKLTSPLKVGGIIVLDYGLWHSSTIQDVVRNDQHVHVIETVQTRNSIYTIQYQ